MLAIAITRTMTAPISATLSKARSRSKEYAITMNSPASNSHTGTDSRNSTTTLRGLRSEIRPPKSMSTASAARDSSLARKRTQRGLRPPSGPVRRQRDQHEHGEAEHERQREPGDEQRPRHARQPAEPLGDPEHRHEQAYEGYRRQQRQGVQQPLDEDRHQRRRLADALPLADVVAAHQLADAHRQQVVRHVADDNDGVQPDDAHVLQVPQQVLPAQRPEQQRYQVEAGSREHERVVGLRQRVEEPLQVYGEHEQRQKDDADGYSYPELGAAGQMTTPGTMIQDNAPRSGDTG